MPHTSASARGDGERAVEPSRPRQEPVIRTSERQLAERREQLDVAPLGRCRWTWNAPALRIPRRPGQRSRTGLPSDRPLRSPRVSGCYSGRRYRRYPLRAWPGRTQTPAPGSEVASPAHARHDARTGEQVEHLRVSARRACRVDIRGWQIARANAACRRPFDRLSTVTVKAKRRVGVSGTCPLDQGIRPGPKPATSARTARRHPYAVRQARWRARGSDGKTPHRLALGAVLPRTRERAPLAHRPDTASPVFCKTAGSSSRNPLKKWYKKTPPPHAETPPRGNPPRADPKAGPGGESQKMRRPRSPGRSRTVSARRQTPPRVS